MGYIQRVGMFKRISIKRFEKFTYRLPVLLLVSSLLLAMPFVALADTENTFISFDHSISYRSNYLHIPINIFHILGITTPLHAVNSSNGSQLSDITDTHLVVANNIKGIIVDHNRTPISSNIIIQNSAGKLNSQTNGVIRYDSTFNNNDSITFDALSSKNVAARFKMHNGSHNSAVILDNFGKFRPVNTRAPTFSPIKYVEIHAENMSYENVLITVSYTEEEIAEFDENKLILYHYTNNQWIPLPTTVDTISNMLTASVDSLSTFAIGQGSGINVYSRINELAEPDALVTISGAVYYDNLTAINSAAIDINVNNTAITRSVTSDSDGNFKTSFLAPSLAGNYDVMVNASYNSMMVNSTYRFEVTEVPLFKLTGNITVSNQENVDSGANISIEYGIPAGAIADNSTILMTAPDASKPTNTTFYVDNIKLISASGELSSESANITGYMNQTNHLNITSDSNGTVEYTLLTDFHKYINATTVKNGTNYTLILSFTNDGNYDWNNVRLYYDTPLGSSNFTVTDTDKNNLNHTPNSTLPTEDGGVLSIPTSVVGTVLNGSTRTLTLDYYLRQLDTTITIGKQSYAAGETIKIYTDVLYNGSTVNDAEVTVEIRDTEDIVVLNGLASWNGINYSISKATNDTWKIGVYHVNVTATKIIDRIQRNGTRSSSFVEKGLIMYVQGHGPYYKNRNITVDGRAYYTDMTGAYGETVNLTIGSVNTSVQVDADGHYSVSISGFDDGEYNINASITDSFGFTDTDNDSILVLSDPFFILLDSDISSTSGQSLLNPNHTFSLDVPDGADVLNASITLTGINTKTEDYEINTPPPISMVPIGTEKYNFVNGTFTLPTYPYNHVDINVATLSVSAYPPMEFNAENLVFITYIDDVNMHEAYVTAGDLETWNVDITERVTPDQSHEIKIVKTDSYAVDYSFLATLSVNHTGHLDTPLNPEAYVEGRTIYAETGDMGTAPHITDITKFIHSGSNQIKFMNDVTSLVSYVTEVQIRNWNYTLETTEEVTDMFVIENIIIAAATDQTLENPQIRHPIKSFANNITVYDVDNSIDITSNSSIVNNEVIIDGSIIGPISVAGERLFNVSYDAPRPNISPSVNRTQYNPEDHLLISADITYHGSAMTDANVSATVSNNTDAVWQSYLEHTGGGTYTTTYIVPANISLGYYNITISAYNNETNEDEEIILTELRELSITPDVTGPFTTNYGGTISGNVADLRTGMDINGATVNITITNQSGIVNHSSVSSDVNGNFSFIWDAQMAGDYNLSIRANDSNMIFGAFNRSISVEYDVSLDILANYNSGYSIPINVSVQDLGYTNVSGATVSVDIVIPTIGTETLSTNNSRLTYANGMYSGTFVNTTNLGTYNVIVNASTPTATGNVTNSFRISNLLVTEFSDKSEYLVDDDVSIWGTVRDIEIGENISSGTYNISIYNGSSIFVTSKEGTISGIGTYSETFSNLPAESYTAEINISYLTIIGGNSSTFDIRYKVTSTIPKSLYGVGETVPINVSVFDTGNVPVIGADLTINITNSTSIVSTINNINITDSSNGYYNTTFISQWSDDFNISVHAANNSVFGDANLTSFRSTEFHVGAEVEKTLYEASENIVITGSLWDSQGSSKWANVTIKVTDPIGTEIENVTLNNQYDNYSYNFDLGSSAYATNYSVQITAEELDSAGSLTAGNSSSFNVEYIVSSWTNRTEYNTNDGVNITVNVKNGTSLVNTATVNINVTNSTGYSIWTGSADSIGFGNYTSNFSLIDALPGDYTVAINVSNPWIGDATSVFTVRELDIIQYVYGPYNLNGTHNGPLVPLIISGIVSDSEHGSLIDAASANISIYHPNSTLAANQIVNTNSEGIFNYNFSSSFSQSSPAGQYNVSISVNDSGITNSVTDNFTIYSVEQSWLDPSWEYRVPILLFNDSSPIITSSDSPVAYWSFNESKGISFNDSSGNGNPGAYAGENFDTATLTNFNFDASSGWINGRINGGLKFDGTNDKVTVGTTNRPTNSFTYMAWVKAETTHQIDAQSTSGTGGVSGQRYVFGANHESSNGGAGLSVGTNGISVYEHGNGYMPALAVYSGSIGTDWNHVAVVYNNKQPLIYLNGNLVTTGLTSPKTTVYAPFEVGGGAYGYFPGSIDDVRIYSRSLSANEIDTIYQNNTFTRQGMAGYWRFDESSGTTAYDTHHIAYAANTNGTMLENALSFDGVNDYVKIPDSSSLDATNTITLEAWMYAESYPSAISEIISKYDYKTNNRSYLLDLHSSGLLRFFVSSDGIEDWGFGTTNTVPLSKWTYVVATSDGTTMKVYINGVQDPTTKPAHSIFDGSSPVGIGALVDATSSEFHFNGIIDEVKIYNYTLSSEDIADRYNSYVTTDLPNSNNVTFNITLPGGSTASTAALYDIEGSAQPATIIDMDGYLDVSFTKDHGMYEGDMVYLYFKRPNPSSPHSMNISSINAYYDVINGTVDGYAITISSDKTLYSGGETAVITSQLQNISGSGIIGNVTTTVYYPNNTIAQIFLNQTNSSGMSIENYNIPFLKGSYTAVTNATINGIPRMENTSFNVGDLSVFVGTDKTVYNTLENVSISVNVTENGNITAANVNLKIYDSDSILVMEETKGSSVWSYRKPISITSASILTDYQVPIDLTTAIYNNTGLVGSWHFSEGSGTTVVDSSGSGNSGILNLSISGNTNSADAWVTGKAGNGINFDGTDDHIDLGTDPSLNITGPITVEAWINTPTSDLGIVTAKREPVTDSANWLLYSNSNEMNFRVYQGGTAYQANVTFQLNEWQHVVGIYNGSNVSVWVNGVSGTSAALSGSIDTNTYSALIGAQRYSSTGNIPSFIFNGTIDEVRIYDRALSPDEIQENYNATKARLDYADLRFTSYNSTTSKETTIPFWQENDNKIWIKTNLTVGSNTVYMYYGSPYVNSASSGQDTFVSFDIFDDTTQWYTGFSPAVLNTTHVYHGTSSAMISANTQVEMKRNTTSDPLIYEINFYDDLIAARAVTSLPTLTTPYIIGLFDNSTHYAYRADPTFYNTIIPRYQGWHSLKQVYDGTGFSMFIDDQNVYGPTVSGEVPANYVFANYWLVSSESWFDTFRVRKYAASEPSVVSIGGEQAASTPSDLIESLTFAYTLPNSPLGNYTIMVSASNTDNAGYNSTSFELDYFDINTTTDKSVYQIGETIEISGTTTNSSSSVNASVNLTVKENLVINPSFETDLDNNDQPDGWITAWDGTMIWDSTVSRSGNHSVKVSRSISDTIEGLWYYPNMYVISPDTNYTFSAWVKTDSVSRGNVRLWNIWYNSTDSIYTAVNIQKSIRSSDGWVFLQGSATSPTNADNVRIHVLSNIIGNVWFDDINMEPEDNPSVYSVSTTSNTSYNSQFSLSDVGSYIVYANGSRNANATLTRSTTTIFTIRNLDVNVSADGPFEQGYGNITISGYVIDNRTQIAIQNASVDINITYPGNTVIQYSNTTDSQGYYMYIISTPSLAGTFNINVSATDYQNIEGTANTTFIVDLRSTLATSNEHVNNGDVQTLTLEVFDDLIVDDFEKSSTDWTYRAGTDGTIQGVSTLRHKSGSQSLEIDYDLESGNEYMFLESGMGAVNVDEYTYITFWLYIPEPDAFNGVALVLENDPTGWSSDERVYAQNPVSGWNYYSFNISTFGMDLSHNHYLTVLIDDDDNVVASDSLYIDDFRLIKGNKVTGADVTINITRPDAGIDSYSTSGDITDNGDGTYTLNYTNTSSYGYYSANAAVNSATYNGTSNTTFNVDGFYLTFEVGGPYIVGDNAVVSGKVDLLSGNEIVDGNVTIDLTYPNGTSVEYYNSSFFLPTESHTQSGTAGGSDISYITRINDGSTQSYAYSFTTSYGDYVEVTWPDNRTINRVKAYYYGSGWPTNYKIQVLDSDGFTWVDKNIISQTITNLGWSPTIEDKIPITETKGLRLYYQTFNSGTTIRIYEIWAYGPYEYSVDDIPLPISGNYTLNVSSEDSYGIYGSAQSLNIPVQFLVSTIFDKSNYDPGNNVTAYIRPFNGTGYESGVQVSTQIVYATNGSVIDTNVTTTDSSGIASVTYTLPMNTTSYNVNSSLIKDGTVGYGSNVTSSANIRMWMDPAEALVGHQVWPEDAAPVEYRNITIYASPLNLAGHRLYSQDLNGTIKKPDGSVLGTFKFTEIESGLYSGNYTVPGNAPEGTYLVEIDQYPGIAAPLSVQTWGCANCHKPKGYIYHTSSFAGYVSHTDGSIAPTNFSLDHDHPTLTIECKGCHGTNPAINNANCRECHSIEGSVNPPTKCDACHYSGERPLESSLNETYGYDLHENINLLSNYSADTPCQSCHGGDIPNSTKPIIPECINCHPESSGSGMQVMPTNMDDQERTLEDFENVSNVNAHSAANFPPSTVSITSSSEQFNEGNKSGKLDYSMAIGIGRIEIDITEVDLTNATDIRFWIYGNPNDMNTTLTVYINNTQTNRWHYTSAQNINWTGWTEIVVPIKSFSNADLLYISRSNTVRIELQSYKSDTGTVYIDNLHVSKAGTHTQYQELKCGICHNTLHDVQQSPDCSVCHQTQEHGNKNETIPSCVECHEMNGTSLVVRNLDHGNDTVLLEIPMNGAMISDCSVCHDENEPHNKQWKYICMDCHRDSLHGQVDDSFSDYEKASTCLKCHDDPHDLVNDLAASGGCNSCHEHRIHGQSSLDTTYNQSIHLDCLRCHGTPVNISTPLPDGLGQPGKIHIDATVGLSSQDCMLCHGNDAFSYELHTSQTVDLSNTTLVDSIINETICIDCHDPIPLFSNTSEAARDELLQEPHAIIVSGHGNVSCFVCHGHRPAQLTLNVGGDCTACHMDPTEEVELINNSLPKNYKTNITDNSTSILLVTSPQVLGHGNAECSECHGHSNSQLTFVGESENDCMECHENNLTRAKLLQFEDPKSNTSEKISQEDNVWTVIPPQVAGHGNVTCLECHDHAPSDFTNSSGFLGPDCFICHADPLKNVTLINNTIPKKSKTTIVDNTSDHWLVTAPQVTTHGNDTNSDGAVNSTDCAVCHGHTNSNLVYISNCHDCHLEPDDHPVKGSGYSSMIPDECLDCHGTIHAITLGGGPDCMSSLCHATNNKPINISFFNNSVHRDLNSGAANATPMSYEYTEACWLCHGNGAEPETHLSNISSVKTCYDETDCHGNKSLSVGVSEHFLSGENITAITSAQNNTNSCITCHNLTDMKVSGTDDSVTGSGLFLVSHYAKNYTELSSLRNDENSTEYCIYCHNNEASIFNTFLTKNTNHGANCSQCHGAGMIHDSDIIDSTISPGNITSCLDCHASFDSGIPSRYYVNMTMFNDSVHFIRSEFDCLNCHPETGHPTDRAKWKWCEDCHVYQDDPINSTNRHNITSEPLNYTFNINGNMTSVVDISDCTYCHSATIYNNSVENFGDKCDYCHEYPDKSTISAQGWY